MKIPRDVLLDAQSAASSIPVCDHHRGVEVRIRKSLALEAAMSEEFGACPFDVTLDCEDGAPIGREKDHAQMVADLARDHLAKAAADPSRCRPSAGVRVHPVDHPAFEQDVATIVGTAAEALCHVMIPKLDSLAALERALGFTRMWSIHPAQIRPILEAFAREPGEIEQARRILVAAQRADWAPLSDQGVLQDRASYRYFWQVLERAHQTGTALPNEARSFFLLPAEPASRP